MLNKTEMVFTNDYLRVYKYNFLSWWGAGPVFHPLRPYLFLSFGLFPYRVIAVWEKLWVIKPSSSSILFFPPNNPQLPVCSQEPNRPILVRCQWESIPQDPLLWNVHLCMFVSSCNENPGHLTSVLMFWSAVNAAHFLQKAASSVSSAALDPLWVSLQCTPSTNSAV